MTIVNCQVSGFEEGTLLDGTMKPSRVKNGRIKFEIGVAKGKKLHDKREAEMKKTVDKEMRQQLKENAR